MPEIAKVFKSGNSQAVRLPKDFHFSVDEVEVSREGDAVILRPRRNASRPWASLREAVARGFSPDFMAEGREQAELPGPIERSGVQRHQFALVRLNCHCSVENGSAAPVPSIVRTKAPAPHSPSGAERVNRTPGFAYLWMITLCHIAGSGNMKVMRSRLSSLPTTRSLASM